MHNVKWNGAPASRCEASPAPQAAVHSSFLNFESIHSRSSPPPGWGAVGLLPDMRHFYIQRHWLPFMKHGGQVRFSAGILGGKIYLSQLSNFGVHLGLSPIGNDVVQGPDNLVASPV
jgi:hypothetical protein